MSKWDYKDHDYDDYGRCHRRRRRHHRRRRHCYDHDYGYGWGRWYGC
jgi:hypothetical protein